MSMLSDGKGKMFLPGEPWRVEIKNYTIQAFEAKELVRIYSGDPDIVPPDPGTRINWDGRMDGDSKVLGTRMQIPEMREICIATYRKSKINTAFKRILANAPARLMGNKYFCFSSAILERKKG